MHARMGPDLILYRPGPAQQLHESYPFFGLMHNDPIIQLKRAGCWVAAETQGPPNRDPSLALLKGGRSCSRPLPPILHRRRCPLGHFRFFLFQKQFMWRRLDDLLQWNQLYRSPAPGLITCCSYFRFVTISSIPFACFFCSLHRHVFVLTVLFCYVYRDTQRELSSPIGSSGMITKVAMRELRCGARIWIDRGGVCQASRSSLWAWSLEYSPTFDFLLNLTWTLIFLLNFI